MSGPTIDAAVFGKRLALFYEDWKKNTDAWGVSSAIAIATRPNSDEIRYLKSISLHLWFFGYELPDTLLIFSPNTLHALASGKKATLLGKVIEAAREHANIDLQVHTREKGDSGRAQMQQILDAVKEEVDGSVTLGTLPKEKPEGDFLKTWMEVVTAAGMETRDASGGVAHLLAVKDETEVAYSRKASTCSTAVLSSFLVPQIETIIEEEKKVTHQKLAEKTEEVCMDLSKAGIKVKQDYVDICYVPIIQSGGTYDLRPGAANTEERIHYGVILCSLGLRWKSYCANVARTYLIDPSKEQQVVYKALLAAQKAAIDALRDGAPLSAPYEATLTSLKNADQDKLINKLTKNVGFVIGLEYRESSLILNPKNSGTVARAGMTFYVGVGMSDLENRDSSDSKGKTYALMVGDTVVVAAGGAPPEVLTDVGKEWKEVAYYLNADKEEEPAPAGPSVPPPGGSKSSKVLDSSLRSQVATDSTQRARAEEQARLAKEKNLETIERFTKKAQADALAAANSGGSRQFTSYRTPEEMPRGRDLAINIDKGRETVLLPIYGTVVPFHIQTIKNITQQQDGKTAMLRINFNVPGASFGAGGYAPALRFPNATFIQEVSYRSQDVRHATSIVQELKLLKRMQMQREAEKEQRASLVRQEPLQLSKGRVIRLADVLCKPPLLSGQRGTRTSGTLEAHTNGFRYSIARGGNQHLDISFRNIKHAFFQPAENARDQCITLIHFHLHDPIMVGKRKSNDVQFYVNVIDAVEALDNTRRSMYDPDEIEEEQRERERRKKINAEFQAFSKRVGEVWERDFPKLELEFDIPFRQLGFSGVPFKTQSFIMPSVNCLVELLDWPFLVITLADIEIVNLERVTYGIKSFDMVCVWKDFNRPVHRIDAIPVASLESVKEWLNQMRIKYYENKLNLNWGVLQKKVKQMIMEDPEAFLADGGWDFLDMEKSDGEGEGDEDGSGESDAYEPTDEEEEEEGSDSDSSGSGGSEDESVVDSEDEDSEEEDSEEEEGLSDDELEAWAQREDKERDFSDSDDDRKKRKGGGRAPPPPAKKGRR